MKTKRGFTVAEAMGFVAGGAFLAACAVGGCSVLGVGDDIKKDAEASVRQTAAELNMKVDGVSCGNRSNSKDMVYCTVNSGGRLIPFSCIGKWKMGTACKMTTVTSAPADTQ